MADEEMGKNEEEKGTKKEEFRDCKYEFLNVSHLNDFVLYFL